MLKLVQNAREQLSFSEEEHAALGFQQKDGVLNWNPDAGIIKDVKLGDKVSELIADSLRKQSEEGVLTIQHLSLWDAFIKEDE